MAWFEQRWGEHPEKKEWIDKIKNEIYDCWQDEYMDLALQIDMDVTESSSSQSSNSSQSEDRFKKVHAHKKAKTNYYRRTEFGAYWSYCDEPLEDGVKPLDYWNALWQTLKDRALCQMAYGHLAIPSTAAECERIFSSAALRLANRRNRLKPDIIEANECLRHWYGAPTEGAFDWSNEEDLSDEDEL
jgi:hypothetical protein